MCVQKSMCDKYLPASTITLLVATLPVLAPMPAGPSIIRVSAPRSMWRLAPGLSPHASAGDRLTKRAVSSLHPKRSLIDRLDEIAFTGAFALAAIRERTDSEFVTSRLRGDDAPTLSVTATDEREFLVSGYEFAARGFLRYFETHGLIGPGVR